MIKETRLCPTCKNIMKPASYKVGMSDGSERLENKIFSYDGLGVIGKLYVCPYCGSLAVIKY